MSRGISELAANRGRTKPNILLQVVRRQRGDTRFKSKMYYNYVVLGSASYGIQTVTETQPNDIIHDSISEERPYTGTLRDLSHIVWQH